MNKGFQQRILFIVDILIPFVLGLLNVRATCALVMFIIVCLCDRTRRYLHGVVYVSNLGSLWSHDVL